MLVALGILASRDSALLNEIRADECRSLLMTH